MDKAKRLWQSMNATTGENQPFPETAISSLLASEQAFIEREPDAMIPCNCCGNYERNADIDVFGICVWCKPAPKEK